MIFETAAIAGVEPWSFTWRELAWMADAQRKQAGSLMALIANVHRDPKKRKRPFTADDFVPRAPQPLPRVSIKDLKGVFFHGQGSQSR